jgi:hypothetical protein
VLVNHLRIVVGVEEIVGTQVGVPVLRIGVVLATSIEAVTREFVIGLSM